jgi:hypothetical protein
MAESKINSNGESTVFKYSNRLSIHLLSLIFIFMATLQPVAAAMISTHDLLAMRPAIASLAPGRIDLLRKQVTASLVENGVPPTDATERADALTHQELAMIQSHLDRLPAGQGGFAVVGVVFLVLILLELVGVINIFNKI